MTISFKPEPENRTPKTGGIVVITSIIAFILIFTYLSLNLKNIDTGYEIQELNVRMKKLNEELDRLKSRRATLLNLHRVEKEVVEKLFYQYPESTQIIRINEAENEDK